MSANTKIMEKFLSALQDGEYDAPIPKTEVHVYTLHTVCLSPSLQYMYYDMNIPYWMIVGVTVHSFTQWYYSIAIQCTSLVDR